MKMVGNPCLRGHLKTIFVDEILEMRKHRDKKTIGLYV
jgi:hypothetical protein